MQNLKPNTTTNDVLQLEILIDGVNTGLNNLLKEATIHFELNKIPFAKFSFISSNLNVDQKDELPIDQLELNEDHKTILLELITIVKENKITLFKGIVKSSNKILEDHQYLTKIECKDIGFGLTQNVTDVISSEKTFDDILNEFCSKNNLEIDNNLQGKSWGNEKISFNNSTSPWDFLVGFLDSIGMMVSLKNGKISGVDLLKKEREISFLAENGINIFSFSGKSDPQLKKSSVTMEVWDADSQEMEKFEAGDSTSTNNQIIKVNQSNFDKSTTTRIVEAILERSDHNVDQGNVSTLGNLDAGIGDFISFNKINEELDGKVLLISGETHTIEIGNWKTEYLFGLENVKSFIESIAQNNDQTQQKIGITNSINGLQIGIVTQIDNDPNSQFRIKVKIPVLSDSSEGIWARLANMNGSKEMGTFFIPDVDDEVIIAFLDNNPDSPVILGSLYSSAKPAPFEIQKENFIKAIVTKEESKIVLDDEMKSIEISTKKGNKLLISEDEKGIVLQDENDNKITMNNQRISLESAKDFTIKANGNIKIEGVQTEIKSSAIIELKGSLIKLN